MVQWFSEDKAAGRGMLAPDGKRAAPLSAVQIYKKMKGYSQE